MLKPWTSKLCTTARIATKNSNARRIVVRISRIAAFICYFAVGYCPLSRCKIVRGILPCLQQAGTEIPKKLRPPYKIC